MQTILKLDVDLETDKAHLQLIADKEGIQMAIEVLFEHIIANQLLSAEELAVALYGALDAAGPALAAAAQATRQ